MEYYEHGGGAVAKLSWVFTGVTPPPPPDTNIAPSGTGYRWSKNTTADSNSNRVLSAGVNDDNLSADVDLNGGVDDAANAWEGAGVVWSGPQAFTSVKFKNGSWDSKLNGAFTANFKLQVTDDGTTWVDSGWTPAPAYNYDSPSSAGVVYTF